MADDTFDNGQPDETTSDEEYPVCPDCGERHAPWTGAQFVKFLMANPGGLSQKDQLIVYSTMVIALTKALPTDMQAHILEMFVERLGGSQLGVDLSRFTPRGQPN